ncbi:MAG: PA0069 family radical SAM protein [Magnetospiraceae bacterium]
MPIQEHKPRHGCGRGAVVNPNGRFERFIREAFDDGWTLEEDVAPLRTHVAPDASRTVITRNQSPDIPFDRSVNPYRGCEHGCAYCFARPTHAYLGLSPGLDFETRLFAKYEAAAQFAQELAKPGYRCAPLALGVNTDCYQPIEKRLKITRDILTVAARFQHPVNIITKSNLILRDLDILAPLAAQGLASVMVSITTLDRHLARDLEPRAPTPKRRLLAIEGLAKAGVPVGVIAAPVIPGLNDHEMDGILSAAADQGAIAAGYVLLRLPLEIAEMFKSWLETHRPDRAKRVLSLVRQCREGRTNDTRFGTRLRGAGPVADLIANRFTLARKRYGLERHLPPLNCDVFTVPEDANGQLRLL